MTQNKPEGGRGRAGVDNDDEHGGEQEGGEVQHAGLRPTQRWAANKAANGLRPESGDPGSKARFSKGAPPLHPRARRTQNPVASCRNAVHVEASEECSHYKHEPDVAKRPPILEVL